MLDPVAQFSSMASGSGQVIDLDSVGRDFCINNEMIATGNVDCASLGFQVPEREKFPVWEGNYLGVTIFLFYGGLFYVRV